eukprot:5684108-Pyramimonas_sp.AAC.1
MAMVLQRGNMAFTNVESTQYRPPYFRDEPDDSVNAYMSRGRSFDQVTLLEWLREWQVGYDKYKRPHARRRSALRAVGIQYARFLSDDFFWQWMLLNVPFRSVLELMPPAMWEVHSSLK